MPIRKKLAIALAQTNADQQLNSIQLHDSNTALLTESLEAILKTPAVILAAIKLPTAVTDQEIYVQVYESMDASIRSLSIYFPTWISEPCCFLWAKRKN